MPTYEFRCPKGHEFERFLKMSEASSHLPCPECGAHAERLVSGGAGLLFKGSGFYLTDYGRNAHRGESALGKPESASSPGSTPEKSDKGEKPAKPEAKAGDAPKSGGPGDKA
ncbi:MAG: FmdB family zinc ribbon protein [Gemmatimonadaceae bacterium]